MIKFSLLIMTLVSSISFAKELNYQKVAMLYEEESSAPNHQKLISGAYKCETFPNDNLSKKPKIIEFTQLSYAVRGSEYTNRHYRMLLDGKNPEWGNQKYNDLHAKELVGSIYNNGNPYSVYTRMNKDKLILKFSDYTGTGNDKFTMGYSHCVR